MKVALQLLILTTCVVLSFQWQSSRGRSWSPRGGWTLPPTTDIGGPGPPVPDDDKGGPWYDCLSVWELCGRSDPKPWQYKKSCCQSEGFGAVYSCRMPNRRAHGEYYGDGHRSYCLPRYNNYDTRSSGGRGRSGLSSSGFGRSYGGPKKYRPSFAPSSSSRSSFLPFPSSASRRFFSSIPSSAPRKFFNTDKDKFDVKRQGDLIEAMNRIADKIG